MNMKTKNGVILGISLVCMLLFAACRPELVEEKNETVIVDETVKETETEVVPELSWAEEKLMEMTLEEKVAQLFIITPEALTGVGEVISAGETTKDSLWQYPVGGLIYFAGNIQDDSQVKEMIQNSQSYIMERSGIPLFISVDEEGGEVARVAGQGVAGSTAVESMSEVRTEERAYEIGRTIGGYLSELGFNLDYAPVADVLTNPENTVVRWRSFGNDALWVSQLVQRELDGMHECGIYGVIKHFPGHGATSGDTHEGYAYVGKTLDEMLDNEMYPFVQAIDQGAAFIMVGHISAPEIIGDDTPSSLSSVMITDILRGQLGYDGIVITDALNMGAIQQNYSSGDAAVQALAAGCDLILMPADFQQAYQAVLDAVREGVLSEERIDESVKRILSVKNTLLDGDVY